jgi:hypothetical protein
MNRIKIFSTVSLIIGIVLFFWWPLSHWFYSDFYHQMLGFLPGTYQESMVKMIGTCGLLPVLCFFVLAVSPKNNWGTVTAISIFSFFLGLTFLYLITTKAFPFKEIINVITTLFISIFLPLFYKWANKK